MLMQILKKNLSGLTHPWANGIIFVVRLVSHWVQASLIGANTTYAMAHG